MMKQFQKGKRVLLCALCLVLCLGTFCGTVLADASSVNLHFEANGSQLNVQSIRPEDLIASICGAVCSDAEKQYLSLFDSLTLTYSTQIPDGKVTLSGAGTELTVNATTYSYSAVNGMTVTWIPEAAFCEGQQVSLTQQSGSYVGTFQNMDANTSHSVQIRYYADLMLSLAAAQGIVNRAYDDAVAAKGEQTSYESRLAIYRKAAEDYQKYLEATAQYEKDLKTYNAYREKVKEYETLVGAYRSYQVAKRVDQLIKADRFLNEKEKAYLDTYEKKQGEYEAFLKAVEKYNADMIEYEKAKKENAEALIAYENYLKAKAEYDVAVDSCRKKLQIMSNIFRTSSAGHSMYGTLTGGTVATVLNHQSDLEAYFNVSHQDMVNARGSTDALIALLSEYSSCEKEEQKFIWYQNNYADLLLNFSKLYSSLNSLFQNNGVKSVLRTEEKYDRYCQFVAHLHVITASLDDGAGVNLNLSFSAYRDCPARTYGDALEDDLEITDTNAASPEGLLWPDPVTVVENPTDLVVPVYPSPTVYAPVKPKEVAEPTAPTPVVPEPEKPATVAAPGAEPTVPNPSATMRALMAEVDGGTLTSRTARPCSIRVTSGLTKVFSPGETHQDPIVTFLNNDGTLLKSVTMKSLSDVQNVKPPVPMDDKISYTFVGWVTIDGTPVNFSEVKENITVYPKFTTGAKTYQITWDTALGRYITNVAYGVTPTCTGDCSKPDDEAATYTFAGWDREVVPAFKDAIYRAVYRETPKTYTVEWVIGTQSFKTEAVYGAMPECPCDPASVVEPTDTQYFVFDGWDREISAVTGDATYTAILRPMWLVPVRKGGTGGLSVMATRTAFTVSVPSGVTEFDLSYLISEAFGKGCDIALTFSNGVNVELPAEAVAALPQNAALTASVSFGMTVGAEFSCEWILMADGRTIHAEGTSISFPFVPEEGKSYRGYAALRIEGQTTYEECAVYMADGNAVFLTSGDEIGFSLMEFDPDEKGKCVINFYVDGALYFTGRYLPGETIEMPPEPTKAATDEETFTFSGWTPAVITTVIGNADYYGTFTATPLASSDYQQSPYTTYTPINLFLIGGGVILAIGAVIFLIVFRRRKKAKSAQQKPDAYKTGRHRGDKIAQLFDTIRYRFVKWFGKKQK